MGGLHTEPPPLLVADFLPQRQEDLEGHEAPPLLDSAYFTTEIRGLGGTRSPAPIGLGLFYHGDTKNTELHGGPTLVGRVFFTTEIRGLGGTRSPAPKGQPGGGVRHGG